MLSKEWNTILTNVSTGTPLGNLFRNYWFPVAASEQLKVKQTKRFKLLGEELVLYRGESGKAYLIEARCPHRGFSLFHGIVQDETIRCPYHGWCFDGDGSCVEMPHEPPSRLARVHLKHYDVQEQGGLIFCYVGEEAAPCLPQFDVLNLRKGVEVKIKFAVIPCNWLQIMENALDPIHLEWLHGHFVNHINLDDEPQYIVHQHDKLAFEPFDHGIVKRRVRQGQSQVEDDWQVGHFLIFPNMFRMWKSHYCAMHFRTPMDNKNTLYFWYEVTFTEGEDYQQTVVELELIDEKGEVDVSSFEGQDVLAFVEQGRIADRTKEKLGVIDKGIILYRKMLKEQIQACQNGKPLMCYFTEPVSLDLPKMERSKSILEFK